LSDAGCHTASKQNADGGWAVTISATQSGVPDTFKMPVPIQINLKDGGSLYGRLIIDKPAKEVINTVPREPETVGVNLFRAVLCRIEE
jgi:hypothetical protein